MKTNVWTVIRYQLTPLLLMLVFPVAAVVLPLWGKDADFTVTAECLVGNVTSWTVVAAFIAWAILFLKMPSEHYQLPSADADSPTYQSNGITYYCFTVGLFAVAIAADHKLSVLLYDNMVAIVVTLNILALCFSAFLWRRGQRAMKTKADPRESAIFRFYNGSDRHPRLWDMDVKQLVNCRIGLMAWQLLILAFWKASLHRNGWSPGISVNVVLQTMYLAKFFYWENGYFNTLDITLDRPGFYTSWGCLVWVPSLYTFPTYYFVAHTPQIGHRKALCFFLAGIVSLFLNYLVDHEKEIFKETKGRRCLLSNDPAVIECRTAKNAPKSYLLTSGFWGTARHLNYTFELLLAFFWSVPGYQVGSPSFLYFAFLLFLLLHRALRDETKCAKKYGAAWKKYCKAVPYRMIPGVF